MLRNFIDSLPSSSLFYRFCRRYVNRCNGENNDDMRKNGELRWLQETLPACKTVFDVGANVGEWTKLALGINPELQVHCFEPSSPTYQRLQSRGFADKVFLNQLGLSATNGELTLHVFSDGAGTNSVYRRDGLNMNQAQTEQIRMETLDSYCKRMQVQEIDLLKIDVEGHELDVLKGAHEMLIKGRIHRIQFEYGGTYIDARILLKDMFDLLILYGYRLYKIYPNKLRSVERYAQQLENFQYQNWVALKNERS